MIVNKTIKSFELLISFIRVLVIKLRFPNVKIGFDTKIEGNCKIFCDKSSEVKIVGSHISFGSFIIANDNGKILIEDSFIGRNCIISAKEQISIGKNCQIAEMVVIRDQNHKFENLNIPIKDQGFDTAPIIIENNVWIAAKATILKGVTIRKNSVVGAHSLVNSNIDSNSVYAGIPAKKIKDIG